MHARESGFYSSVELQYVTNDVNVQIEMIYMCEGEGGTSGIGFTMCQCNIESP